MVGLTWRMVRGAGWRAALAALLSGAALLSALLLTTAARDFDRAVRGDSGAWLGADFALLSQEPLAVPAPASLVIESLATIATRTHPEGLVVHVKAVDPARFPLRGRLLLDGLPLRDGRAAVSADLPVERGESLAVGHATLTAGAWIRDEPDRLSGQPSAVPRLLITMRDYERSRLARTRPATLYRYLFLAGSADADQLAREFPQARALRAGDGNPDLAEAAQRTRQVLHALSWLALLLAAGAVALVTWLLFDARRDDLAVWKTLGARPSRVAALAAGCAAWTALPAGPGLLLAVPAALLAAAPWLRARPAVLWRGGGRPLRWLRGWRARPGQRHAPAQFAMLFLAASALSAAYQLERYLAPALQAAWPGAQAGLFVINASPAQWQAAQDALRQSPDLAGPVVAENLGWMRLGAASVLVSCRPEPTPVTLSRKAAARTRLRVGDELVLDGRGRGRIQRVVDRSPIEEYWRSIELPCSALEGTALLHHAAIPVRGGAEARVRRLLLDAAPGMPVEDRQTMVSQAERLVAGAARQTRVLSGFLALSALVFCLLLTSAAWQAQRSETGIWKALGATPQSLLRAQALHSGGVGLAAGLLASALVLLLPFARIDLAWGCGPLLAALAASGCGLAAAWRTAQARPAVLWRGR